VNILQGRASGDGIFARFRQSVAMVFTRPYCALGVDKFFTDVSMIFISKKSI
jgi:hypothetical protein